LQFVIVMQLDNVMVNQEPGKSAVLTAELSCVQEEVDRSYITVIQRLNQVSLFLWNVLGDYTDTEGLIMFSLTNF
jgi:hypothetical protein